MLRKVRPRALMTPAVTVDSKPKRTADGDNELTDAQTRRIAERAMRQIALLGLHDGQVRPRIVADDAAADLAAIAKPDADALAVRRRHGDWSTASHPA